MSDLVRCVCGDYLVEPGSVCEHGPIEKCAGCSHKIHPDFECFVVPQFTREKRCGCTFNMGVETAPDELDTSANEDTRVQR